MKKINKRKKHEEGQAIVEFALVLPIFLLLVMGILDFGWLFYNYISVENSARNAARIACVESETINYSKADNTSLDKVFTYADIDEEETSNQENDVINTVKNTLPSYLKNVEIKVEYSYDDSDDSYLNGFDVTKRKNGDVTVEVTCDMKVLTPVLGVTCDNMTKTLTSTSTFKVEKNTDEN
jgi:Flp pilus assembly protein TadG